MNEPVASMGIRRHGETRVSVEKLDKDDIPLYTHPVKEQDCYGDGNVYRGVRSKDSEVKTIYFNPVKELTDEEILGCWVEEFKGNALPSIDFARAILKRAFEK